MSLNVTFMANGKKYSFNPNLDELEVISSISPETKKDVDILFGNADFGEKKSAARSLIITTIANMLECIAKSKQASYSYPFTCKIAENCPPSLSTGGLSGIIINGENYRLHSGVDRCVLTKVEWNNGYASEVASYDVRDRAYIDTDNLGRITIMKKKNPFTLVKKLKDVNKWLESTFDEDVSIILG